jgi:hypothetical protein
MRIDQKAQMGGQSAVAASKSRLWEVPPNFVVSRRGTYSNGFLEDQRHIWVRVPPCE